MSWERAAERGRPPEHLRRRHRTRCPRGANYLQSVRVAVVIDATREYVLHNRYVPSSWIWRTLTRRTA